MSILEEQIGRFYTHKEYEELSAKERQEIIEGVIYAMTPAPSIEHQRISRRLFLKVGNYLLDKECEVFSAPLDVILSGDFAESDQDKQRIWSLVQPDLVVFCDKKKIKEKFCVGAPDLVMEIVSPTRPSMDYVKKLGLYEKYRVKEYWIIDPTKKHILIFNLQENNEYGTPEIYDKTGTISTKIFPELVIKLQDVFYSNT